CDSGSSGCCDSGCLPPPGPGPGPVVGGPAAPTNAGPAAPSGPPASGGHLAPLPTGAPNFTPPSPIPLGGTSQYYPGAMPYGYNAIQTAAYRPNYPYQPPYYPGYYPGYNMGYAPAYNPAYYGGTGYYPMTPGYSAPNYWYGGSE